MENTKNYRIRVKTLEGRILTYHNVKEYFNTFGMISFIDDKTKELKLFSSANCEIEEDKND